ncbi:hypothetical protein ARAM_005244 [Aspergillus rambellii]|uniref:Cytochrome P450 monooxygenase n=1 Tax=Aspergillus rambellii TaxID=308745 RepID=A0A0F8WVP3_9EURO|nr:hypothetical protein ARAM_005244 [Aspergillus rambellii]
MLWSALFFGLVGIFALDYLRGLYKNIRIAQRTGLRYVLVPFSFSIPLTILFNTRWLPYMVNHWLPEWAADLVNDVFYNLRWSTKDRQVKKFGKVYLVVTPRDVLCHVADASVVTQVVNTRGSFPKPVWQYKVLELYGPNVVTCDDAQWARHRRQTATIFNEKNNDLVWKESIRLAQGMLEHWRESSSIDTRGGFKVEHGRDDILKFTLNVFSGAGFGVVMPFKPVPKDSVEGPKGIFQDTPTPPQGFDFTFRSVVAYMNLKIANIVFANLMLPQSLKTMLFPFIKQDIAAHKDLERYMKTLISTSGAEDTRTASNLIQGMLKYRKSEEMAGSKERGLSDLEIMSNALIFTIAGHETSATTLRYSILLLALDQDVQDWVYQGILEATRDEPSNATDWNYASVYPKLVTPLCVMLEAMRLYPPVVTIPKWTGESARTIHYQDKSILLEPGVNINLIVNATHYSEEYWGSDAEKFHPQRWDASNKESFLARNADLQGLNGPGLEYPTIHKPVRGAYAAFSDGHRACLGKKFAQVEIVVALAVILREYRVELAWKGNEGRTRAERILKESAAVMTLAMRDDVPLVFHKRLSV